MGLNDVEILGEGGTVVETCPVCRALKKTCEKLGDTGGFCAGLIEELKQNKLTETDLIGKINARFSPDEFRKAWDKTAETID